MTERLVLVTGATGYIGSRLIPLLLERGLRVRALARDPRRLREHRWLPAVEMIAGDVADGRGLAQAMRGVEAVYYLVHSMTHGRDYARVDLQAARNVRQAAAAAGVRHIIYLGGLADPDDPDISPHMRSRIETGAELARGPVPVTEFRASVIIGPGSISFEMIRFLTEQLPVLVGPRWLKHRGQPVAARDVLAYLLAALERPQGGVFEIGGPDVLPYTEIMLRYARARGLRRGLILLPWMPLDLMAWLIEKLTPVPRRVARPLVEGLMADSVIGSRPALGAFPEIIPLDYQRALEQALAELHPDFVDPLWMRPDRPVTVARHEGFLLDHRRQVLPTLRVAAFAKQPAGRPVLLNAPGFGLEAFDPGRRILLRAPRWLPGRGWLEWRADPLPDGRTRLSQTAYFAPRGLAGFLCWYGLAPLRRLLLQVLIKRLARAAMDSR